MCDSFDNGVGWCNDHDLGPNNEAPDTGWCADDSDPIGDITEMFKNLRNHKGDVLPEITFGSMDQLAQFLEDDQFYTDAGFEVTRDQLTDDNFSDWLKENLENQTNQGLPRNALGILVLR